MDPNLEGSTSNLYRAVLDKGYVRLVSWTQEGDLAVVNAARASFAKESKEMRGKDIRLLRYLAKHGHTSPFRHASATFEIKAPLLVARQWWKYVVGSDHSMEAWNEASRRYVTMEPEFYVPDTWRRAPENRKQGSGDSYSEEDSYFLRKTIEVHYDRCLHFYHSLLNFGVAPEQARLVLPAYAMYTVWRWTCSVQSLGLFLNQRLEDDAQAEIREYAREVRELGRHAFPHSIDAISIHL